MKYGKIGTKFERRYGETLPQLSKKLKVSRASLCAWESQGFDIFYKAKELHILKGNKILQRTWQNMKSRCGNPKDKAYKYYGAKGIRIQLNKTELLLLWKRDNASALTRPSIDRINSSKDYEFSNCRFIEMAANAAKARREHPKKTHTEGREVAENSARVKRASSEKSGENGHIHITISEELSNGLKLIRDSEGISMQRSIRRAILNYLKAKQIGRNDKNKK